MPKECFPLHLPVQFSARPDLSALVAPPYDVLDAAAKQRLLDKDSKNIVAIDPPPRPAEGAAGAA